MWEAILQALRGRRDTKDWSLRRVFTRGTQLYALPKAVEGQRTTRSEHYGVEVLRETRGQDGEVGCGSGVVTLLPEDDVNAALERAALMAGLVHNPPHGLPGPAAMPAVPLLDERLRRDPEAALEELHASVRSAVAKHPQVRLTAAEFFVEEETTRLANSRGIDAEQTGTLVHVEWVLISGRNGRQVESFVAMTRRRVGDLDLETEVGRHAGYVADLLEAGPPGPYRGPVVMRGASLATFMHAGVLKNLSSGELKYKKVTAWEVGQSVLPGEVRGDPLTLWANRRLPFGTHSNRFDDGGLPAQRILLIYDNKLMAFTADQRYAEYLSLPATGAFGDIELPAGTLPAAQLLAEPHVEVVTFSWFNPNPLTGDFASEIRLGYFVEGDQRKPFRGGMLVGNVLKALADVRWSSETGFYGDYQGPTAARFGELSVAAGTGPEGVTALG